MSKTAYTEHGIILKTTKLKETDLIVQLLNDRGELVSAFAYGPRKPGSKFGAQLSVFNELELLLRPGKGLASIAEASLIYYPSKLASNYSAYLGACALMSFLSKSSYEGLEDPLIFAMSAKALRCMNEWADQPYGSEFIALASILKLLAQMGFQPNLDLPDEDCGQEALKLVFDMTQGSCDFFEADLIDPSQQLLLSPDLIAWLRFLLFSSYEQIYEHLNAAPVEQRCPDIVAGQELVQEDAQKVAQEAVQGLAQGVESSKAKNWSALLLEIQDFVLSWAEFCLGRKLGAFTLWKNESRASQVT